MILEIRINEKNKEQNFIRSAPFANRSVVVCLPTDTRLTDFYYCLSRYSRGMFEQPDTGNRDAGVIRIDSTVFETLSVEATDDLRIVRWLGTWAGSN